MLEWWCCTHETDKFKAVCNLCDKEIQVANNGYYALLQHAGKRIHKEKATIRYSKLGGDSSVSGKVNGAS